LVTQLDPVLMIKTYFTAIYKEIENEYLESVALK